jgi:hypothetical protein
VRRAQAEERQYTSMPSLMPTPATSRAGVTVEIHNPTRFPAKPERIGGSMSDDWNNVVANQAGVSLMTQAFRR